MKIDILAIVSHPDDAELCCAGTLLKHKELGYSTGIVDLTRGELGSRGTAETRKKEAKASAEILQLDVRETLDLGDGTFEINHENKLKIIKQIRRFQPEIVLTNAPSDRHPDHERGGKLVAEACFYSGLVKIETEFEGKEQEKWRPKQVWKMMQDYFHHPDIVVDISEYWEKKLEAVRAFETQFYKENDKEPATPISSKEFWDFLEARARSVARPIGAEYGEGFMRTRYTGVNNLFDLK